MIFEAPEWAAVRGHSSYYTAATKKPGDQDRRASLLLITKILRLIYLRITNFEISL